MCCFFCFFLYKISVCNCSNYKIFSDRIKRYQGQHVVQAWNDQQVVVYDCMSRLWGYLIKTNLLFQNYRTQFKEL